MGHCLRFDPVVPAPTSILFARPPRPEVRTYGVCVGGWVLKGEVSSSSLFTSSGDHHTPLYEAC